jgi:hypothetical protein
MAACCPRPVTPEIAATRGVPLGEDCISPRATALFHPARTAHHARLRDLGGKPVGLKLCVGCRMTIRHFKAMLSSILLDFIDRWAEGARAPRPRNCPTGWHALREGWWWPAPRWWAPG